MRRNQLRLLSAILTVSMIMQSGITAFAATDSYSEEVTVEQEMEATDSTTEESPEEATPSSEQASEVITTESVVETSEEESTTTGTEETETITEELSSTEELTLEEEEDSLYYTVNADDTATITGSRRVVGEVVIPSTIGGYKVTKIGSEAFKLSKFSSFTLPDTVTEIGSRAFYNCTQIT